MSSERPKDAQERIRYFAEESIRAHHYERIKGFAVDRTVDAFGHNSPYAECQHEDCSLLRRAPSAEAPREPTCAHCGVYVLPEKRDVIVCEDCFGKCDGGETCDDHFESAAPAAEDVPQQERLAAVSLRMFQASQFAESERVLESYGVGFEDLAQEIILKLHDPDEPKVTWNAAVRGNATTRSVFIYLAAVLRNDFLDLVRSKRCKRQRSLYVPTEGDDVQLHVDPPDPEPLTDDILIHNETHWSLRKRLDDDFVERPDDDLQLYVMLQFDGDRYVPYKPREAAEQLGIDAKELYLLKDKFERRLRRLFKLEIDAARAEKRENSYEQEAR